jgi:hypothetical protein
MLAHVVTFAHTPDNVLQDARGASGAISRDCSRMPSHQSLHIRLSSCFLFTLSKAPLTSRSSASAVRFLT